MKIIMSLISNIFFRKFLKQGQIAESSLTSGDITDPDHGAVEKEVRIEKVLIELIIIVRS